MSNFKEALKKVLGHEGGYANVTGDTGGETYQGISRKNWPNWRGWGIIDKSKPLKHNQILKDKHLADLVEVFYYEHFWKPIQGDRIKDQKVTAFLFDWYINSGYHAIKAIQSAVGVKADGLIGSQTLAAVNAADQEALFVELKTRRLKFYKDIVNNRPDQAKFLTGWQNRVEAFA